MRGGRSKLIDIDKTIADLARVFDEGGRDEGLAVMREMFERVMRRNAELELEVMRLIKKHLGQTSERVSREQLAFLFELLGEADRPADAPLSPPDVAPVGDDAPEPPATKKRKHRGRGALPDSLRREEIVHTIPDGERACLICGGDRVCIGHETSERVQFKPAELYVEVHKREKLACGACEKDVSVAAAPAAVISKGRPGASLLARVVAGKYVDHEPLHRMSRMIERLGLKISVSTLADWVAAGALALEPIAKLIREKVLSAHVMNADDTGLKVLDEKAPGGAKRGHLWFYVGDSTHCAVAYTPDWCKEGPGVFLSMREGGWLVADAYKGWDHLYKRAEHPLTEVGCWAHARRAFVELADRGEARAAVLLHHVQKLYEVERISKAANETHEERLVRRKRDSTPIIEEIRRWCVATSGSEPPKSELARATGYIVNQWKALSRFLEDGALPLDNTLVERALRGVSIGRKNYLFAGSDQGAMTAATIYTLVATCKLCGVEPVAYLTDVLTKIETGSWPHGRLGELLPDEWAKTAPPSALRPTIR